MTKQADFMTRRHMLRLMAGTGALTLAGCTGQGGFGGGTLQSQMPTIQQPLQSGTPVALLLPLTATGNAGKTAQAMKSAADMALAEMPSQPISIIPYDTKGTPEGAQAAAQAALSAGAQVVLGPLFSSSVRAIAPMMRQANVPVVCFSTDSAVAGQGIYLLSFLPESDIDRIIRHSVSAGKRSFGALLPSGAYGSVAEAAIKEGVARYGGQLRALDFYEPDRLKMQEPVQRMAAVAGGSSPSIDALIMPDGAAGLEALSQYLATYTIDPGKVTFLGSGQWDDPVVRGIPAFANGLYAAPDPRGFQSMATRFQGRFGYRPPRLSSLAYDATSLVAALAAQNRGFNASAMTSTDGFDGVDGIFRFKSNGTNERGLAVMAVATGAPRIVVPAPRNFAAGF